MYTAVQIAKYFLSKDQNRKLFNKTLTHRNNRDFYEGNARLNKYLHLTQNIYIAKTGKKLFSDDLYAYDNGAVAPTVLENYSIMLDRPFTITIDEETRIFLDKIFKMLENASLDELIEISHEDSEWQKKNEYYNKEDQKMDSLSHIEEYREQYRDVLKVMDA